MIQERVPQITKHVLMKEMEQALQSMPTSGFTYHLSVLIAVLYNEDPIEKNHLMIEKTRSVVQELKRFYEEQEKEKNITRVIDAVDELIEATKTNTVSNTIKSIVLKICGALLGVVTGGIIGGIIGGITGLYIGLVLNYNLFANIKAVGRGFYYGLLIGAEAGYHAPTMFFQSHLDAQLEFCRNELARLRDELDRNKYILHKDLFHQKSPTVAALNRDEIPSPSHLAVSV